jgi:hypothetical protein
MASSSSSTVVMTLGASYDDSSRYTSGTRSLVGGPSRGRNTVCVGGAERGLESWAKETLRALADDGGLDDLCRAMSSHAHRRGSSSAGSEDPVLDASSSSIAPASRSDMVGAKGTLAFVEPMSCAVRKGPPGLNTVARLDLELSFRGLPRSGSDSL